jgi:hypothetical protein
MTARSDWELEVGIWHKKSRLFRKRTWAGMAEFAGPE